MNEIYLGEIVNTHGIKGELRIISNFKYKKEVFKKGFHLYVGKSREDLIINSYRVHKNYDMVTFEGLNDINEVLIYKGEPVYINREDINVDGYLLEDLIGMEVYSKNKKIGKVIEIINNRAHEILVVFDNNKKHLIPFVDEFVECVDIDNKKINIILIEGLINED